MTNLFKMAAGLLILAGLGLYQNCSPSASFSSAEPSTATAPTHTASVTATCSFNGQTLQEGDTVTAYLTPAVAYGSTCQSQQRSCHGGLLSGSYAFSSCGVNAPSACLFNGQSIPSGGSVQAAQAASALSCQYETRVCNDGVLSGSFQYPSCQTQTAASCNFGDQTIPSGSSVTAYSSNVSDAQGNCPSEQRTCNNGVLSGSYNSPTCVDNRPQVSCPAVTYTVATDKPGVTCTHTIEAYNGVYSGLVTFSPRVSVRNVTFPEGCSMHGTTRLSVYLGTISGGTYGNCPNWCAVGAICTPTGWQNPTWTW